MIRIIDVNTQVETTREATASEQEEWDAGKAKAIADAPYREIARLESEITLRRIRDAYKDSTWMDAQEALIKTQRDKL
jgi:hypothetical protein